MAKLYPPYLNGTIPAFTGDILPIPFSINKTVHPDQVTGIKLLIKDLFNNEIGDGAYISNTYDLTTGKVYFDITDLRKSEKLKIGQYYKLQIAYIDNNNQEGYFSTVGVTKYTSAPLVYIDKLSIGALNGSQTEYVGAYQQENGKDLTEKLYSSYFVLYDEYGNELLKTEEKIHNSSEDDNSNIQKESFSLEYEITGLDIFQIEFNVTSLNGLKLSSQRYQIVKAETIDADFSANLIAENNFEEGYVNLYFTNSLESSVIGTYLLTRIDLKENTRTQLKQFRFEFEDPNTWCFKDYTCEQGKWYQYSVQQFNEKGLYSNDMLSNAIFSDFENMYLTDGKRQLKIKYNPKVASFKNNLLENKIETIGSQYPFIFRNPIVKYKEFPISGLISYLSDEEGLFFSFNKEQKDAVRTYSSISTNIKNKNTYSNYKKAVNNLLQAIPEQSNYSTLVQENNKWVMAMAKEYPENLHPELKDNGILIFNNVGATFIDHLNLIEPPLSTNLVSENFEKERKWKLEVLEWLNNGEVKMFKSAAEGNYLVRILNVSLTPEDQLGRMIHSFSCTAYEIAKINSDNLHKYSILDLSYPKPMVTTWSSWVLKDYLNTLQQGEYLTLSEDIILGLNITGFRAGDTFDILLENSNTYETIMIGATGSYYIDNVRITAIRVPELYPTGVISYQHYVNNTKFDSVNNIKYHPSMVFTEFGYNQSNIYYLLDNVKYQVNRIHFLNFEKIPIKEVTSIPEDKSDKLIIYHYTNHNTGVDTYVSADGTELQEFSLDNCYNIQYNDNVISLNDRILTDYNINIEENTSINLQIGHGIKLNLGFTIREIEYLLEETNENVKTAKEKFLNNKTEKNYNNFIMTLEKYLQQEGKSL